MITDARKTQLVQKGFFVQELKPRQFTWFCPGVFMPEDITPDLDPEAWDVHTHEADAWEAADEYDFGPFPR
jgi:hypothetical protein